MINNHLKNRMSKYILIVPSLMIIGGVTLGVIFNTIIESLGYIPELSFTELTFKYYKELFSDPVFIKSLSYSLKIGIISAALSTIVGCYFAYYLSRTKSKVLSIFYRLPILLSYVAAAALIYNTYSDKGLLYHLLSLFGVIPMELNLIYNSNGIGVILLNMFKGIPFVAFSVAPIFMKAEKSYSFVARNLGSTKSGYIIKILLPLAKRAILTSFLILINFNTFSYEGFYYLGPSSPISLGVYAYKTFVNADISNRIYGMAINNIMILISLILCVLYYFMIKDRKGNGEDI